MNETIRAFASALRGVLEVLTEHVIMPVHAHAADAWEQLDNWLADRNLTIQQVIGNFLTVAFGFMALGFVVDLVGIAVGGWFDKTNTARGIIAAGTVIGLIGGVPLLMLLNMAQGLFDLVMRGGEVALEILSSEQGSLPHRVRCQLEQIRNRRNMGGVLKSLYVAYAAMTISFLCWPTFHGLYGIVVAIVALTGIVSLRKLNNVKGHGTTRLMMSGVYGLTGGVIVFGILYFIARPLFFWGWGTTTKVNDLDFLRSSLIAGTIVGLVVFVFQIVKLRLGEEENDIRRGDMGMPRNTKVEPEAIDPATGRVTAYKLVKSTPFNWSKLCAWPMLLVYAVIALLVWTTVLGHQNPFFVLFSMDFENLMLCALAVVLVLLVYFGFFWKEKPATTTVTTANITEVHHE